VNAVGAVNRVERSGRPDLTHSVTAVDLDPLPAELPDQRYASHEYTLASNADTLILPGADPIPYLLEFRVPDNHATNLTLTDRLPANMLPLVPNSPNPAAVVTGPEGRWDVPVLGESGARFTLDVQLQEAGRWPTNSAAAS